MAEITFEESLQQIDVMLRRAERARADGAHQSAIDAFREALAHPCAHHQVAADEMLDDIHHVLREAGRYDEAIAAKREAIDAGYRSVPDPEADIAEILLAAGRREEADQLYATLREQDPDDVWLYNSAAYAYGGVDDRAALRWSLDGIAVALATGDPDQVVVQLLECAEVSWEALDEPVDQELVDQVEAFVDAWQPIAHEPRWKGGAQSFEDRPCGYCGYEPERTAAELDEVVRRRRRRLLEAEEPEALARLDAAVGGPEPSTKLPGAMELAVGWFPAEEWAAAIERWPHLLDDLPAEHLAYSHATEARIKRLARHLAGHRLHVSPLTVDELAGYAAEHGHDPGSGEARSAYAAEILRLGSASRWPPGRNDRCWCGSSRKYKKCCGPVAPAPDEP